MLGIFKKVLTGIVVILLIVFVWLFFSYQITKKKNSVSPIPKLETIVIEPTEKHSASVIFLHGLGDRAENWQNNFSSIAKNYPSVKFVIPKASWKFVSMNWNVPMSAWYNIRGNIKDIMNLKQDKEGLLKSVYQIKQIIQEEVNSGISPEKILVGGFSQGGSVALAVGLTTEYQLGGIICMSGFLPCREEIFGWKKQKNQVPFNFYHGYYDNLVPFEAGEKSAELIKNQDLNVKFDKKFKFRSHGHFWSLNTIEEIFDGELGLLK